MAAAGVLAPDHGAGHGRDDGPHARRHRDRRGRHRARSDAARRHRHELRDRSVRDDRAPALPRAARAHVPVVPPERGPAVGRQRPHALRPHAGAARGRARALRRASSGSTSSAAVAARRPSTCARSSSGSARARPIVRTPEFEPGCSSIYSHVPFHQELAYLAIGERTNANGSRKFRDAMLEADWDTCVLMAREQVKEGAHVLDVCVDYVGRDGTLDMDEIAGRFATQASLPLVFDSTEPDVVEAGLKHHGGKAILNSANLEEGDGEGKRMDRVFRLATRVRRRGHLPHDRRGGPGARPPTGSCASPSASTTSRIERYGIEPTDLIFDTLTFPLSTGDDDLRRDAMETIEAIRRIKTELPGRVDDPRPVERLVRPEARGPPRAQQRVPARVPRGRPRRRDRARGAHHADAQDRRPPARGRARPHLRPAARELRPAHRVHGAVRRRRGERGRARGPFGLAGRGTAEAPHHRRRPRRPRSRPRRAAADAARARDHQRRAARRA